MAPKLRRPAEIFTNAILHETTGAVRFRRVLDRTFRSQTQHAEDHGQSRSRARLPNVQQPCLLHDRRADLRVEKITKLNPDRDRDEGQGWKDEPTSKAHGHMANQS